jgi:excisionase family DNA binding protein
MPLGQLYTANDAAQYLRLTEQTVLQLARSGKLHGVRIGNRWRFTPDELEQFIAILPTNSPSK